MTTKHKNIKDTIKPRIVCLTYALGSGGAKRVEEDGDGAVELPGEVFMRDPVNGLVIVLVIVLAIADANDDEA